MAEIQRDMFPKNMMHRIQTPVTQGAVSNLSVSRQRPWGGILQPVPQQPEGKANG